MGTVRVVRFSGSYEPDQVPGTCGSLESKRLCPVEASTLCETLSMRYVVLSHPASKKSHMARMPSAKMSSIESQKNIRREICQAPGQKSSGGLVHLGFKHDLRLIGLDLELAVSRFELADLGL